MHIIIRGNNSKSMSGKGASYQGFTPHWNTAIDKKPMWIGTRQQYDRELKSRDLRVSDPDKEYKPKRREYKVSDETRQVAKAISQQTDKKGNFNPSSSLKEELIKRKVIRKRSEVEAMQRAANQNGVKSKGGFF